MSTVYSTQNDLLMKNLLNFYEDKKNLNTMLDVINGNTKISLRILDWFVTNYSKKNYTSYQLDDGSRFKVYIDYRLQLKAYQKKRFDPFCRWERISIPYSENECIQTTIGQINFFRWAIEKEILDYINDHYEDIENDMNSRNSTSKRKNSIEITNGNNKTRKKREELSIYASKSIKKEKVEVVIKFN